ncbi:MAG: macro domain-containing protein [Dehalococcoidia bacterium]
MTTTIEVVQGDITDQDVDAIVNAANNHLWMGAGVAGAIVRRGGSGIEDEAIRQGPVAVGDAVVTGAGSLPAKHVIHAAVMGQDLVTDAEKIRRASESALDLAQELRLRSIALPALGTGVGGFPVDECARIMVDVARARASKPEALPTVRFVLFDEAAYQAFQRAAGR